MHASTKKSLLQRPPIPVVLLSGHQLDVYPSAYEHTDTAMGRSNELDCRMDPSSNANVVLV